MNATSTTNSTYIRYLNVIAVDDSAKTITTMFSGAKSGLFQMSVRSKTYGKIDTTNVKLDVKATVTSWSPKTGSIYGGTLLTIQGTNFGKTKTDNPINIVSATGKINACFVTETAATQIKCRVDTLNMNKANGD